MNSKNAPGCTHEEKDGECMRCRLCTPEFPPNSSGQYVQLILAGHVNLTQLDASRKDILIKFLAGKLSELQSAMSKKGKKLLYEIVVFEDYLCVFFNFVNIDENSK